MFFFFTLNSIQINNTTVSLNIHALLTDFISLRNRLLQLIVLGI